MLPHILLPLGAIGLSLAYIAGVVIYRLCLSPLRKFPGPKIAAVTRLPHMWHTMNGDIVRWIHDLHTKYGDVVRVAPDELSYATGEGWKDIYGHAVLGKKATHKDLRFYGPGLMADTPDIIRADDADHSRFRRNFSHAFSDRALKEQEQLIRQYVDLLVSKLHDITRKNPQAKVEMVRMYNFTTFDIMGDLTFGEPLGLLEGSEYNQWVAKVFASIKANALLRIIRYFPWLAALSIVFVPRSLRQKREAHIQYCIERVDRRLAKEKARPDIWGLVLNQTEEKRLSTKEMYANSQTFMIAGTETTATLLSGLTYQLLINPSKLEKLTREVRGAFSADEEITISGLARLEFLHACIEEGLRMYPPVPVGMPRVVPAEGKVICGEMVPGKTAVSVNQWATYRNPKNFKHPNTFIPERWTNDPEFATDQKAALQPFSTGPRNCLGKNLAYHEMRLILAKVLWHFDLSLCEESVNWTDQKIFTIWEKNPLMVRLTPRRDN
ncbi:hypothetical protein VTN77DRAFT_714 [Rasamsonia byssochlamydoides]|uniref:uncharacterized protein n=1 Tax=Rasamsonia byssochlamydoides TaxID=89139 RepID=UPI00374315FE